MTYKTKIALLDAQSRKLEGRNERTKLRPAKIRSAAEWRAKALRVLRKVSRL